ncbi:hypothetical protein JTB14_015235 [Gonioctena quinquepunctata]|nr:hypothetical protein JTB14_015235 [Gonioctena quinquepunctata]
MAFFKFSAIFFAILVLQAHAHPQTAVKSDIIDNVVGVLNILTQFGDSVLNASSGILENYIENTGSLEEKVDKIILNILEPIISVQENVTNAIWENGNEATKSVIKCIQKEKEGIQRLVSDTVSHSSKCLVNVTVKFAEPLLAIVKDLQGVQGDLKAQVDKLSQCKTIPQVELACATGVANNALKVVEGIPDAIKPDVQKLKDAILSAEGDFQDCAKNITEETQRDVIEVIDKISNCVKQ